MLFTNIQLDDFTDTLAHFLEQLEMEGKGVKERDWVMMSIVNLGTILENGKASGVIHQVGELGPREGPNISGAGFRVVVKRATTISEDEETKMDVDDGGELKPIAAAVHVSPKSPTRKASPFARSTLNPYLTVALTSLTTVSKHPQRSIYSNGRFLGRAREILRYRTT
jgi:hypothetical protein